MSVKAVSEQEIIGTRFGRLVVVAFSHSRISGHAQRRYFNCRCDCGKEKVVPLACLRNGDTKSCGCLHDQMSKDRFVQINMTHGACMGTALMKRTYNTWIEMKKRCENPKYKRFDDYGGRGIIVCERWQTFERFLEDMGEIPSTSHSIDRKDNNGNYEPDNCRWATSTEQTRNKRNNVWLTHAGQTHCLTDWSKLLGIPAVTLRARLYKWKWPVERALSEPIRKEHRNRHAAIKESD